MEGEPEAEAKEEAAQIPQRDWFLDTLVDLANRLGSGMGVTLNIKGTVIHGNLISGKLYFEELAKQVEPNPPDDPNQVIIADAFRGLISKMGEDVYSFDKEDEDRPPPNFIHLKDARILTGNGLIPSNEGVLWRGRLTSVDGVVFGDMAFS